MGEADIISFFFGQKVGSGLVTGIPSKLRLSNMVYSNHTEQFFSITSVKVSVFSVLNHLYIFGGPAMPLDD